MYKFPISHNPLRKVSLIQSFKQNFFKIPSDQYQFSWFIHAFENGFLEEILEDDVFFKIAVLLIEPMLHTLDNNTHNEKAFIEATITKMVNKPPDYWEIRIFENAELIRMLLDMNRKKWMKLFLLHMKYYKIYEFIDDEIAEVLFDSIVCI